MTTTDERQDADLDDHQHRLERLEQAFPTPDTAQGGAQRARIHVPSPDSLLTVGARGSGASAGRAEGPGGVAIYTVENLGAEVQGSTIVDTDGDTILHAGERVSVVAEGDAALSSNAHIRVGSVEDIEITAGEAGFSDPAFTVRPSVDVPDPPEVDTTTPREPTEDVASAWSAVWRAWDTNAALRSWSSALNSSTEGLVAGSVAGQVSTTLGLVRAGVKVLEGLWMTLEGVASAFEDPAASRPSGAKLKLHGAGGVGVTSPNKISLFSRDKVSIGAPIATSIKGGWKASLKSGGNTKVYGIASATLASEGAVGIKGRAVGVSGDFIEAKAKQAAAVTSKGTLLLEAKEVATLDAPRVALAAEQLGMSARDSVLLDSQTAAVEIEGQRQVMIRSPRDVTVRSDDTVQLRQGGAAVTLTEDEVRLRSGRMEAKVESSRFSVGGLSVERGEIRLRGQVRLG